MFAFILRQRGFTRAFHLRLLCIILLGLCSALTRAAPPPPPPLPPIVLLTPGGWLFIIIERLRPIGKTRRVIGAASGLK